VGCRALQRRAARQPCDENGGKRCIGCECKRCDRRGKRTQVAGLKPWASWWQEQIREFLENTGMAMQELSLGAGLSHSVVSQIMRGQIGVSKRAAKKLAAFMEIEMPDADGV
jgi:ribosome-binding protein aMBF1 (putative translation factor)